MYYQSKRCKDANFLTKNFSYAFVAVGKFSFLTLFFPSRMGQPISAPGRVGCRGTPPGEGNPDPVFGLKVQPFVQHEVTGL